MSNETWKYASDQFLVVTEENLALCGLILTDHLPKLEAATALFPAFGPVFTITETIVSLWNSNQIDIENADAGVFSKTLLLNGKLDSLTHKPDDETNSILDVWDLTIRTAVAYGGGTYGYLLPHGRETLTAGGIPERIDALESFQARLLEQTTHPTLVALATPVAAFRDQVIALRDEQLGKKSDATNARDAQEELRVAACQQMYETCGVAMGVWKVTPERVATLWSMALLRSPVQHVPAAPGLPIWVPAARTLTVAELPAEATRLAAWRQGPGSAPEELLIGEPGALTLTIPAEITFDTGDLYQLWVTALNSRGQSTPSPVVTWTATP